MIRSPNDKGPVGPMPETAHQKDDEGISDHLRLTDTAAAQRNIDVIPKPRRQRDVPPTPKLCNVTAEIRHIEVAHQFDAEQFGRTDGDVTIAREVAVYLEGEEDGCQQQGTSTLLCVSREHLIHIRSAIVGHHNLLEQTPKDLAHTVNSGMIIELPLLEKLRQEVRRPLDGTGYQLWEKRDEGKECDDVLGRCYLTPIYVDGVRQGLERVERDAHRQDHLQQQPIRGNAEQLSKLSDKEIVILEKSEDAKIEDDIQPHPRLGFPLRMSFTYQQTAAP